MKKWVRDGGNGEGGYQLQVIGKIEEATIISDGAPGMVSRGATTVFRMGHIDVVDQCAPTGKHVNGCYRER